MDEHLGSFSPIQSESHCGQMMNNIEKNQQKVNDKTLYE